MNKKTAMAVILTVVSVSFACAGCSGKNDFSATQADPLFDENAGEEDFTKETSVKEADDNGFAERAGLE